MQSEPTEKELAAAREINRLEEASFRPPIIGGLIASAISFVTSKVSRGILSAALAVYLSVHAWQMFNEAPKLLADLKGKRAETLTTATEAQAITARVGEATRIRQTMLAQLAELQGKAGVAQAQADAAKHKRDGVAARTLQLRVELAEKEAKRDVLKAEADASIRTINGIPGKLAQMRAEVVKLEDQANQKVAELALKLKVSNTAGDMESEIDHDIDTMFRKK